MSTLAWLARWSVILLLLALMALSIDYAYDPSAWHRPVPTPYGQPSLVTP